MITIVKKWAILSGAVFVAGGAVLQVTVLHFHDANSFARAVTGVFAPAPAAAPVAPQGALPPAPPKAEPAAAPAPPHFDVVRVEPDGSAVVAGQGEPGSKVALLASGRVIAETPVDSSGHFALVPPALPPGGTALSLRQTQGGAATDSTQSVAVSVPEKGGDKGGLVVALTEPGQAAKLLAVPASPLSAAPVQPSTPAAAPQLAIRSVELENGNGFFASGTAPAGTKLGIYLNNSHLADVVAGADTSWTVKLQKGLPSGHYTVRADAAGGQGGVASRVEVPFDVPAGSAGSAGPAGSAAPAVAAANTASSAAAPLPPAPDPAHAVIAEVKTTIVRNGDNLWDISRIKLGNGARYTRIYAANAAQIRDPNLIYPGQVFVVPAEASDSATPR